MSDRPAWKNNPPTRRGRTTLGAILTEEIALLSGVRLVVVLRFHGLNGPKTMELRRWTWAHGARYRVVKNRLAKRALAEAGIDGLSGALRQSCALLLAWERPDAVLLDFEDYLARIFPRIRQRKKAGPDRIRAGMGGLDPAYGRGFRPNPNQLEVALVWLDGQVLTEADRAALRAAGGVSGLQGQLLALLQGPGRQLLGTVAAPGQQLLRLLAAHAAALAEDCSFRCRPRL